MFSIHPFRSPWHHALFVPLTALGAFLLSSCGGQHAEAHEGHEGGEGHVQGRYMATTPWRTDTTVMRDYVCQVHSIQHIEVRALEKGYLQDILVDEGQLVREGQLMFRIRPVLYLAEVQRAQAEADLAGIEYGNTKALADSNVVSPAELAMAKARLFTFYAANYPQYELIIDNQVAMQKGVSIGKAMENLNILIGSTYEQGFIRFGRFFKVYTQAGPEYRRYPSDLENLFVKNEEGEMVPYSSFMRFEKRLGPNEITRYNMYNSSAIRGLPAVGHTSGDAIKAIQEVAKEHLPRGYDIAWEGLSYDEARRGNEAIAIFLVVLIFVYLVLAAQYESFVLPLVVILSLPVGVFGSFLMLKAMGLANDVYAQIGLIMLIGLLGKNAVLIVEFAVQRQRAGATVREAAIEGARARFRPILMTSFAFIAGLIPLVISSGAGAIGNRTIGSSAMGGMLVGTLIGVLIIPGLYYVFANLIKGRTLIKDERDEPISEEMVRHGEEQNSDKEVIRSLNTRIKELLTRKNNER
jgi:HAE1 family hydrophobic/amphiphilic exporter-1